MDELEISGKRYISTRRAARENGYHSDYMGQLIRGKKVVGQKVGRSWYIEEGSLNAYLGKAPVTPEPAPVEPAPAPAEAPVERLVVAEAPAPAVPVEVPVAPAAAPAAIPVQPVAPVQPVVEVPVAVHTVHAAPVAAPVPAAQPEVVHQYVEPQVIHHVAYTAPQAPAPVEKEATRIPIHTPAPMPPRAHYIEEPAYTGGLRYADDTTPSIPAVTRMPQVPQYETVQAQPQYAPAARTSSALPFVALSVIGVVAIVGALFASNFVTATIVSGEGESATVHYSIHW